MSWSCLRAAQRMSRGIQEHVLTRSQGILTHCPCHVYPRGMKGTQKALSSQVSSSLLPLEASGIRSSRERGHRQWPQSCQGIAWGSHSPGDGPRVSGVQAGPLRKKETRTYASCPVHTRMGPQTPRARAPEKGSALEGTSPTSSHCPQNRKWVSTGTSDMSIKNLIFIGLAWEEERINDIIRRCQGAA